MASWHNRRFGYQPPLPTIMQTGNFWRRTFIRDEWKGDERFLTRRDFGVQREFRPGQWRRTNMPWSRLGTWA